MALDHFIGRKVESVKKISGEWVITLEGDIKIRNQDKRRTPPKAIKDMVLLIASVDDERTRLVFGIPASQGSWEEVILTPTKYEITWPGETYNQEASSAFSDELEQARPPDPSSERIHDELGATESTSKASDG